MENNFYLGLMVGIFFIAIMYIMYIVLDKIYQKREKQIVQNVIKHFEQLKDMKGKKAELK